MVFASHKIQFFEFTVFVLTHAFHSVAGVQHGALSLFFTMQYVFHRAVAPNALFFSYIISAVNRMKDNVLSKVAVFTSSYFLSTAF
jgi:hypothetical protein